ncbi:MAG: four helix bundle protein [Candidatus Omnitrophica bacterium]|nr:four helix bundle protein [Candidatus Omnitrophota bacterium]
MKIKRFENLECWQEARMLINMLYDIVKKVNFYKDYRLRDQMIGAGISIMNNICEGFDSQSNIEFVRFLRYSRRSISEVQNCLYISLDQNYISQNTLTRIYEQASKVRQIVDGLIRYLRKERA